MTVAPQAHTIVELAYASTRYERITRVKMTEQQARYWIKRIVRWSDVLRVIIRGQDGAILEDDSVDHRILGPELRERCYRVSSEAGPFTLVSTWTGERR